MRGRKNPPLDLTPVPEGTPLTFDVMARAYLEERQTRQETGRYNDGDPPVRPMLSHAVALVTHLATLAG